MFHSQQDPQGETVCGPLLLRVWVDDSSISWKGRGQIQDLVPKEEVKEI